MFNYDYIVDSKTSPVLITSTKYKEPYRLLCFIIQVCACSSVGLECLATNQEVGGSNPSRRAIN